MTIFRAILTILEPKMYQNVPEMSKILKIDDYFRHFRHLSKFTVHFRHLSKILVHFRYIPVHFCEILYRESPVDFRKIFDRQKFSTFGYRELSKVKNFRQTHGLTTVKPGVDPTKLHHF